MVGHACQRSVLNATIIDAANRISKINKHVHVGQYTNTIGMVTIITLLGCVRPVSNIMCRAEISLKASNSLYAKQST